jgi:hypothetical protein
MNEIEYVFGTGDGTVHVWSSQADLELTTLAIPDAVQLDFDGDGLADDVMWDSHGTGVADVVGLDLDDDGVLDHFYTDPSGLGTWDHSITGAESDTGSEPLDWIVRPDPGLESGAAPEHVVAQEFSTQISDSGAAPVDGPGARLNHPASWSDQQATLDQVGALHDHRAASAETATRSADLDDRRIGESFIS